jgi:hypothetical protein
MFNPDGTLASCKETLTWHEGSWEQGDVVASMGTAFYEMLYNTLACGKELEVTPQQVRRQIAVIAQCYRQNPRFAAGPIRQTSANSGSHPLVASLLQLV